MRRNLLNRCNLVSIKAELLQEGIFFLVHLFARDILVMKKLEIEKTKPTFKISTFKTDIIKMGSPGLTYGCQHSPWESKKSRLLI